MNSVYPKCMPRDLDGNKKKITMWPQFSSRGYFMPCCWYDNVEQAGFFGLDDEELKLENCDNVIDIFNSTQWNNFIDAIYNNQELLPEVCYRFCGIKEEENPITAALGPRSWVPKDEQ